MAVMSLVIEAIDLTASGFFANRRFPSWSTTNAAAEVSRRRANRSADSYPAL